MPKFDKITCLRQHFLVCLGLAVTSSSTLHRERKEASRASTWTCRINRAYVSRRHDTDEAHSVTWLRRPIGLIKNLLEGPSAFLMQSQHSGFCQMFYSLCLNINGMWWMLNVFVDIFAQSPVDYARGNCVCMCVCVCSYARLDSTHTRPKVCLCGAISGRRNSPM